MPLVWGLGRGDIAVVFAKRGERMKVLNKVGMEEVVEVSRVCLAS